MMVIDVNTEGGQRVKTRILLSLRIPRRILTIYREHHLLPRATIGVDYRKALIIQSQNPIEKPIEKDGGFGIHIVSKGELKQEGDYQRQTPY